MYVLYTTISLDLCRHFTLLELQRMCQLHADWRVHCVTVLVTRILETLSPGTECVPWVIVSLALSSQWMLVKM